MFVPDPRANFYFPAFLSGLQISFYSWSQFHHILLVTTQPTVCSFEILKFSTRFRVFSHPSFVHTDFPYRCTAGYSDNLFRNLSYAHQVFQKISVNITEHHWTSLNIVFSNVPEKIKYGKNIKIWRLNKVEASGRLSSGIDYFKIQILEHQRCVVAVIVSHTVLQPFKNEMQHTTAM